MKQSGRNGKRIGKLSRRFVQLFGKLLCWVGWHDLVVDDPKGELMLACWRCPWMIPYRPRVAQRHERKRWAVLLLALIILLISGTWFIVHAHAQERELWEYRELAQIVCRQESQGEVDPDEAVGRANEIGRCQIKPRVAKEHGYRFAALAVAEVSYQAAAAVLLACTRNMRNWWLKHHPWAYRHAYCYKEGAWSDGQDPDAHRYAKLAASDYAAAKLVAMTTFRIAER